MAASWALSLSDTPPSPARCRCRLWRALPHDRFVICGRGDASVPLVCDLDLTLPESWELKHRRVASLSAYTLPQGTGTAAREGTHYDRQVGGRQPVRPERRLGLRDSSSAAGGTYRCGLIRMRANVTA